MMMMRSKEVMLIFLCGLLVGVCGQFPFTSSSCALIVPQHDVDALCITFQDVNQAFEAAREGVPLRRGKSGDFHNLGDVIVETSGLIAKKYDLPVDVVNDGLPLIDTTKTVIDHFCPARAKKSKCEGSLRFRSIDGTCNNIHHPQRGATSSPFRRLLPASYADGISDPRVAVSGRVLPTARFVSSHQHRDLNFHDHAVTVFLPAWGQLIDHDMAAGAETKDLETDEEPKCCDKHPNERHPACWPIDIPSDDPFYSKFRQRCMNFVRSATGLKEFCKLGSRSTFNTVTSVLDASFVYGSDGKTLHKVRLFEGGLLESNPLHRDKGLKDLLPPNHENPDAGCKRPHRDSPSCFLAGDGRVNQQVMLVTLHTLFMREHNRIATELGHINKHWDDERIFQETRHIIAALVQHITYNEFLPMVLGKHQMKRYGLLLKQEGYDSSYDPELDPSLPVSFFAAAFRFGHSLIPSAIERWSLSHQFINSKKLSDMLQRPFDMFDEGAPDQFISGFMNQVSQAVDDSVTKELTNHLFKSPRNGFGADLAALNMQRGRDHGVPSYNAFREFCGLRRAHHWDELSGVFTNDSLHRYSEMYGSPEDIDLWSAGISERPLPGSMVGPVFGCIMGETFRNLRQGDRFWYEHSDHPGAFTLEQLKEIRRTKLSRIICDNGDHIESAQVYVMVLPDPEINPRVACKSSVLPRINLDLWRDDTFHKFSSDDDFNKFASVSSPSFGQVPTSFFAEGSKKRQHK